MDLMDEQPPDFDEPGMESHPTQSSRSNRFYWSDDLMLNPSLDAPPKEVCPADDEDDTGGDLRVAL
jgi:hypothetical protein